MTRLYSYILGFVLSVVLTLVPLGALWLHEYVDHQYPSHGAMYGLFVLCALLQLFVQLYFFLHMGEERRPRLNLGALSLALVVVFILVGGTLWIMRELEVRGHAASTPFIEGKVSPQTSND